MLTESKPVKLVPFYTTPSGRTTLHSNSSVRKIYIKIGDAEFLLDVSSISKDYIRKHADKIDELVAWVEEQVRNEPPDLGVAELEIVDGRGAMAALREQCP